MKTRLHQVFYISRATMTLTLDVQRIVRIARARNATLGVTGALVYSGEHFAQVLEGLPEDLEVLMRSIRHDTRHRMLWEWPIQEAAARWYPDWTMGYLRNDNLEAVVEHLHGTPPPLPPLEYFVRWLVATCDVNRRSRATSALVET
jgi:Sensors of blue-light using FAD